MLNKLESVLMPLAEKIGKNKYLIAIRDGFLLSMPLLIVGSFFLLVANFPIPGWTDFWARFFGDNWASYFSKPTDATFSIMAVLAVIGIGYSFAEQMNVDKLFGAAIALVSWFLIMPYEILVDGGSSVTGIPLNWVGSKGIFVGIIVAFLSVHIYAWVNKKGWVIKMPDGVPPTVSKSFSALIPAGVSILVFFIMNIVFAMTPYKNAFNFIFTILQTPLLKLGNTLPAMVIAYIFLHFFWFFGVNGGSVVGAVFKSHPSDTVRRQPGCIPGRPAAAQYYFPAVPGFVRNLWRMRFYIVAAHCNAFILPLQTYQGIRQTGVYTRCIRHQ